MTRHRLLPVLVALLVLMAGAAWLAWALEDTYGDLDQLAMWSDFRQELTMAAALAAASWIGLVALGRSVQGSDRRAVRSMGQLQSAAALLVAIVTVAILATDFSSTLISLGLVGFGLTLALQRPILALAGWATIFVGGMFREGDRIQVGDLEGDVLAVTLFTTRLWELGGADSRSPGRPTARIRTVSNALFLEQPVANATTDTAIVFDEFVVNVAFEADLGLAERLLQQVAEEVLDPQRHEELAEAYRRLTRGMKMEAHFPSHPAILLEARDSWMDLRLRYLVDARQAGRVQTRLTRAWIEATDGLAQIPQVYPRVQPMAVGQDGRPVDRV